jgi:hypothetical protein
MMCRAVTGTTAGSSPPAPDSTPRPALPGREAKTGRHPRLHVDALGATDGLEALERLALIFKPEE